MQVSARRERFTLPIVPLFPPDPNPALPSLGDRAIYPYTRAYRFGSEPVEREMEALVLENDLLNLQVVPALGGRLWNTTNRQTNRPLFYTPKHVGMINFGLRGAWYSGGVEFNFPRGHTVIANEIVPAVLRHYPDGASAAIVGGVDLTRRVGWSIGIRLEPGCSSIHFDIFLYNRTSLPVNYSWWLNASIPPSPELEYTNGTTEVRAHFLGRREHLGEPFNWPLHEGKDYRWYNQCVEPTSLFQLAGDERWFGYYLHDLDEGVIRIGSADAPGLKFWNSGQAEEGYLWGKYQICGERYSNSELQSGRPETQMDLGILPAHHYMRWTEVWRPVWGLGGVTCASESVALNLLPDGNRSSLHLLGDRIHSDCTVLVRAGGDEFRYPCNLIPKQPVTLSIPLPAKSTPLAIEVIDDSGENIFSYHRPVDQTRRSARTDALHLRTEKEKTPEELTAEELTLEAERLDRLMQPLAAVEVAEKALAHDQGLIAAHLLLARHDLMSARYEDSRKHCLAALWRDPANEAAHYLLALSELWGGNTYQAEIEFEHMLGHSYLLSSAAWFELAQIRLARKDWIKGLQALSRCLEREANHIKAYALRGAVYRHLGRLPDAQRALNSALELAPIDPLVRCEIWRIAPEPKPATPWKWTPLHDREDQYVDLRSTSGALQDSLETACDYLACGFLDDAIAVLEATLEQILTPDPMALYFLGYLKQQVGNVDMASTLWQNAATHHGNYVYSFRREEETALRAAVVYEPQDGLAHTLLGMLELYRLNMKKAIPELEQAIRLRPKWEQPIRLLSICQRMLGMLEEAAKTLEHAVEVNPGNPGLYVELDELLARLVDGEDRRKKLWDTAPRSILDGDHARGRFASFLIDSGEYERAIEILLEHTFFPEEGSSVYRDLFVSANLGLAIQAAELGQDKAALEYARKAASYPDCLGLSTPFICYDAPAMVLQAAILQHCGEGVAARELLERAAVERHREINEAEYFSGLAYRYLGQEQSAREKFEHLVEKSKLDAAWPGRDVDYCVFLAVLGSAGLGHEIPSLESLPPGMQKKAAIYVRLCKSLLPIQGEVKKRKNDDSFSKT